MVEKKKRTMKEIFMKDLEKLFLAFCVVGFAVGLLSPCIIAVVLVAFVPLPFWVNVVGFGLSIIICYIFYCWVRREDDC